MKERITLYEVGLRDGLQNERALVPLADKLALLERLVASGIRSVEATSFVSAAAVPQMADCVEVIAATRAFPEMRATALVVNEKGYERARLAGVDAVAIVVVVSESLALKNSRMSVAQSLAACRTISKRAATDGIYRRVYLAPAWVCPYEGAVAPDHVIRCADAVLEAGADELAIADTIGHAHPRQVGALFRALAKRFDVARLAAHLHDTQALALANAAAAIEEGVRTLDASIGGLGGCPFAPGAAGNLATEDLALLVDKMGFESGVDLDALWRASAEAGRAVGRTVGGRTRAWWEQRRRVAATVAADGGLDGRA